MNWNRFKNRQVHNDWLESFEWGNRCLICGRATTHKAKEFWEKANRFASWFVYVIGISLLLSAIVLMIIYVLNGNELFNHGSLSNGIYDWFWILIYAALGASFLYQRELIFDKEAT